MVGVDGIDGHAHAGSDSLVKKALNPLRAETSVDLIEGGGPQGAQLLSVVWRSDALPTAVARFFENEGLDDRIESRPEISSKTEGHGGCIEAMAVGLLEGRRALAGHEEQVAKELGGHERAGVDVASNDDDRRRTGREGLVASGKLACVKALRNVLLEREVTGAFVRCGRASLCGCEEE
ncbi:MAG: hypothetical protein ABI609_15830 [Acidobacteriota bacterium]